MFADVPCNGWLTVGPVSGCCMALLFIHGATFILKVSCCIIVGPDVRKIVSIGSLKVS